MYNFMGWRGANSGHPGVFLNAEDQDNYDFVYFWFVAIYKNKREIVGVENTLVQFEFDFYFSIH